MCIKANHGIPLGAICDVCECLIHNNYFSVTKYLTPKLKVKATYKWKPRKNPRTQTGFDNQDIVLTIGRPNYTEKKFVAQCQLAAEPFPVKKMQVKQFLLPK